MSEPSPTETSNKRTVDQAELSTDDNRPAKKQQLDEQVSAPAAELPQSSSTSAPVEVVITATQATDDLEEAMNAQPEAGPSRSTQKNGNKNQKGKAKGQGKPNKYKGTHDRGVWERRPPRELPEGEEKEARLPKKKVALLLGFSGAGYNGMQ
jgi:tRNA pseudouridine38-40 synthase